MRDALQLQVVVRGRVVVEQQHGAVAAGEVFLEREDLPPVAQRIARQQAHLGERVEHDRLGRMRSIISRTDFTISPSSISDGMVQRVLFVWSKRVGPRQLEHLDARRATIRATSPLLSARWRSPTV